MIWAASALVLRLLKVLVLRGSEFVLDETRLHRPWPLSTKAGPEAGHSCDPLYKVVSSDTSQLENSISPLIQINQS